MADAAAFWDRVASRYAERPVRDAAAYERTLERTRAALSPGDAVLELGCGTGTTALRLAQGVQRVLGVDISANMIAIARARAAEQGVANLAFRQADLAEIDDGAFDAALAFNLLHLCDDLPATLRAIHARLRSGGVFVSKTICLGGLRQLHLRLVVRILRAFGVLPKMRPLRTDALEAAIAQAGFAIVERDDLPKSPPARFIVARKL